MNDDDDALTVVPIMLDASLNLNGQVIVSFGPMQPGDVGKLFRHIAANLDEFTDRVLDHLATAILGVPSAGEDQDHG